MWLSQTRTHTKTTNGFHFDKEGNASLQAREDFRITGKKLAVFLKVLRDCVPKYIRCNIQYFKFHVTIKHKLLY